MANRQDVEMLQNALQELGQGAFQRKQAQSQQALEMQRNMLEQQFRQAQLAHEGNMETAINRRADVAEDRSNAYMQHLSNTEADNSKRMDLANQARVTADLKHSDGTTMTFTGTPQQLQSMQDAAAAKGDKISVENKKNFAASFNVGGAQFSFDDPDAADKFATNMKANHGIDVYAPSAPNVTTTPGGQELVTDAKGHVIKGAPPAQGATQTIHQVANPTGGAPLSLTNLTTHLPASGAAPAPAPSFPQPTPQHISMLQAHPEYASFFDQKFGPGASDQVLKAQQPPQPAQPIPGAGGMPIPTSTVPSASSNDFDTN